MEKKITKDVRFDIGIEKWVLNDCQGVFDYATGVGKTTVGIKCSEYVLRNINEKASITIIVPNATIKDQWDNRIKEALPKKFWINFNLYTINELLASEVELTTTCLGFDELHEYSTPKALEFISKNIKFNMYFGLTASTDDRNFWKLKGFEVVDTITEEEAIELGFISDFIEFNLGLKLNKTEQADYDKQTYLIEKYSPYFEHNTMHYVTLVGLATRGGVNRAGIHYTADQWCKAISRRYQKDNDFTDILTPKQISGMAFTILKAIRKRQDILKEATSKQEATIKILEKFDTLKAIVFSESTSVADRVFNRLNSIGIPSVIYHSKLKPQLLPGKQGKLIKYGLTRLKNLAIKNIESGLARVLVTGSSFDKGYNREDIKLSITISGTRDNTKYKQRSGRAKRVFKEQKAILVNLYILNTVDVDSIKSRQYNVTHTIHSITTIDEIDVNIKSKFNVANL